VLLMVYFDLAILLVWQVTSIQQGNKGKKHRDRYGYIRPQFSSDVVNIHVVAIIKIRRQNKTLIVNTYTIFVANRS
jgi:hypothetical protein